MCLIITVQMLIFSKYFLMKYFCSAIWNPNSTPVLFGIFSKFIALFSRVIWDEELYKCLDQMSSWFKPISIVYLLVSEILNLSEFEITGFNQVYKDDFQYLIPSGFPTGLTQNWIRIPYNSLIVKNHTIRVSWHEWLSHDSNLESHFLTFSESESWFSKYKICLIPIAGQVRQVQGCRHGLEQHAGTHKMTLHELYTVSVEAGGEQVQLKGSIF